jgi:hypothetical protein
MGMDFTAYHAQMENGKGTGVFFSRLTTSLHEKGARLFLRIRITRVSVTMN